MPVTNLDKTATKIKEPSPRYPYVNQYIDRHGRKRTYLRRGKGMPQIPLPDPESADFSEAYRKALWKAGAPTPRVPTPMIFRIHRALSRQKPAVGVYLLIRRSELIYIGSSKNMVQRVADHQKNGREFDQAFYISTTEGERPALEKLLIRSLRPTHNRAGKPK